MRLFVKTRESIGRRKVRKILKTFARERYAHNFDTAGFIAVLFDAGIEDSFNEIKNFRKYLKDLNIKTEFIGYIDQDEVHPDMILLDKVKIITRKDLDFFQRPKDPDIVKFLEKEPDILIDLCLHRYFPVDYILSLSKAHFKVGCYEENSKYDMMIHVEKDPKVAYLIEQVKNYVSIINSSKSK